MIGQCINEITPLERPNYRLDHLRSHFFTEINVTGRSVQTERVLSIRPSFIFVNHFGARPIILRVIFTSRGSHAVDNVRSFEFKGKGLTLLFAFFVLDLSMSLLLRLGPGLLGITKVNRISLARGHFGVVGFFLYGNRLLVSMFG